MTPWFRVLPCRAARYGCALGNLVVELSDQDEQARTSLSAHFAAWEGLLANGFRRMQDDRILPAKADPDALAHRADGRTEGGTCWRRPVRSRPDGHALDMALAHIESLTSGPTKTAKPGKTATSSRRASAAKSRRKTAAKH